MVCWVTVEVLSALCADEVVQPLHRELVKIQSQARDLVSVQRSQGEISIYRLVGSAVVDKQIEVNVRRYREGKGDDEDRYMRNGKVCSVF